MLVKTKGKRSGVRELVSYVLRPSKILNKEGQSMILTRNIASKTEKGYTKTFLENAASRKYKRRDMLQCHSTVIGFHTLDHAKITPEILRQVAWKYCSLRSNGEKGIPFLAVAHFSDSIHLHVIEGSCNSKQLANRQDKQSYIEIRRELTEYIRERWPELEHSTQKDIRKEVKVITKTKELPYKNRRTLSEKDKMKQDFERCYSESHTPKELISAIEAAGYTLYERNGRIQGAYGPTTGLKHRIGKFISSERLETLQRNEEIEIKLVQELESIRAGNSRTRDSKDLDNEMEIEREADNYDGDNEEVELEDNEAEEPNEIDHENEGEFTDNEDEDEEYIP